MVYDRIRLDIREDKINLDITEERLTLSMAEAIIVHPDYDTYTGKTEITPTQQEQVLDTAGKAVLENIKINAIPSNYGLVTWDGTKLTIS